MLKKNYFKVFILVFISISSSYGEDKLIIQSNIGHLFEVSILDTEKIDSINNDLSIAFELENIFDSSCYLKADFISRYLESRGIQSGKAWLYRTEINKHQEEKTLKPLLRRGKLYKWTYHVATFLAGSDGNFYVIDTGLFNNKVEISKWYRKFIPKRKHGGLKFYKYENTLVFDSNSNSDSYGVDITGTQIKEIHFGRRPDPSSEFYSNSIKDSFNSYNHAYDELFNH